MDCIYSRGLCKCQLCSVEDYQMEHSQLQGWQLVYVPRDLKSSNKVLQGPESPTPATAISRVRKQESPQPRSCTTGIRVKDDV